MQMSGCSVANGPKHFDIFRRNFPKMRLSTIFDVGANLGQSSLRYQEAAPEAAIWAFEPVRATFDSLVEAVPPSDKIKLFNMALGDAAGQAQMSAHKTSASNRMVSLNPQTKDRKETIIVDTGDDFCAKHAVEHINFLKIDTEGFDLNVLKGFSTMLKAQKVDLVQVEASMHRGNRFHVQLEDLKSFLEDHDYAIFSFVGPAFERDRPQLRRSNVVFASGALIETHRNPDIKPLASSQQGPAAPLPVSAAVLADAEPARVSPPPTSKGKMGLLGGETAITLVFNKKYSEPTRVLLYSMQKHSTLDKSPLVIITDDVAVAEDKFFQSVAHNIELVDETTLAKFSTIKGERVPAHLKTHFAPKYTFLKFLLFKNRGFKRHVFMDCDMLCMGAFDHELLTADYEAKAVLETSGGMFPVRDEPRDKFMPEKSKQLIERRSLPNTTGLGRNINSGFLCLQDSALSEEMFEAAIEIASTDAFVQEQAATSELIRRRAPDVKFMELPIWYNAKRRIFDALGEEYFEENRHRIKVLHFIPGKPWSVAKANRKFIDHVWWQYEAESREWAADIQSVMI